MLIFLAKLAVQIISIRTHSLAFVHVVCRLSPMIPLYFFVQHLHARSASATGIPLYK